MTPQSSTRRDVGTFALMLTGLGSIIGSDWQFGRDLLVAGIVGIGFHLWGVSCGWRTPDLDAALAE